MPLGGLALGDVLDGAGIADGARRIALAFEHRFAMGERPADRPVGPNDPIFIAAAIADLWVDRPLELGQRTFEVFGRGRVANHVEGDRPIERKPVNFLGAVVIDHLAGDEIIVPHALLRGRQGDLEPLLNLAFT